jgi:hypothetical protein
MTRAGEKLYASERREPTFGRRAFYGALMTLTALAVAIAIAGFFF